MPVKPIMASNSFIITEASFSLRYNNRIYNLFNDRLMTNTVLAVSPSFFFAFYNMIE